jgi:hypothetical protein
MTTNTTIITRAATAMTATTTARLVNFLRGVAESAAVHQATPKNLAVCFAPSLADPNASPDALDYMAVSAAAQHMMTCLLGSPWDFPQQTNWGRDEDERCPMARWVGRCWWCPNVLRQWYAGCGVILSAAQA